MKTEEDNLTHLLDILLDSKKPGFNEIPSLKLPTLNESQNKALDMVLAAQDVAIIHGPPGTGKTTTILHAILETLKTERQVLVCAPSNAAVDLLVEKLDEKGINVLRVGHPARVTEKMLGTTLDARVANHKNYKELKAIKREAEDFKTMGQKYKRNFGPAERSQRNLLFKEAKKLRDEADQLEFYITNDILDKAQVIACTLVGANNYYLKGMHFGSVFIDEAAQGLEPATWIPIVKANRVVFAGDHCQLPPTIKSFEAARKGLNITLFEKAIKNNEVDVMLSEQYRMNKYIMNFPGKIFYKQQLIANEKVANWKILEDDLPLEFIDTAGSGFEEKIDPETKSSYNPEEAGLLRKLFIHYMMKIDAAGKLEQVNGIGIISPYKAQVHLLQDILIDKITLPDEVKNITTINTVDSFQGQERDIIFISLVRSNDQGEIGFLSDIRRMNVAITRARKKLVIIGDSATIGNHDFYSQFLDYVGEIGAYRSAFEFMHLE